MSQQKKLENIITNRLLLSRLLRLPIVQTLPVSKVVAYIGLLLVNKGKLITLPQALRIIHHSKLDWKIENKSCIPCTNILEALIYLVICKRKLLKYFFTHPDLPVWSYEHSAPLFDIMKKISKKYQL